MATIAKKLTKGDIDISQLKEERAKVLANYKVAQPVSKKPAAAEAEGIDIEGNKQSGIEERKKGTHIGCKKVEGTDIGSRGMVMKRPACNESIWERTPQGRLRKKLKDTKRKVIDNKQGTEKEGIEERIAKKKGTKRKGIEVEGTERVEGTEKVEDTERVAEALESELSSMESPPREDFVDF